MTVTTEDLAAARQHVVAIKAEREESDADYSLKQWEAEGRAKDMAQRIDEADDDGGEMTVEEARAKVADLGEQRRRILACARLAKETATAYATIDADACADAEARYESYAEDVAKVTGEIESLEAEIAAAETGPAEGDAVAEVQATGTAEIKAVGRYMRFASGEPLTIE